MIIIDGHTRTSRKRKKKERKLRRLWKSSEEGTSERRASRKERTNRKETGTRKGGKSLTLEKYAIYFINVNPKSRGPNGGGG